MPVNRPVLRMQIQLNGTATEIPQTLSASELLGQLDLGRRRVALEVNGKIVPRSKHGEYHFRPDDKVEIVHAIGGG
jgi:sulfur carrier protein